MITHLLLVLIYIQNSITMPHLAVIQFMHVIKWPQSHSDGSCENKNVHGNNGFYSTENSCFLDDKGRRKLKHEWVNIEIDVEGSR